MANRSQGTTRVPSSPTRDWRWDGGTSSIPDGASTEPPEITEQLAERAEGLEKGSSFDWDSGTSFFQLFDDPNLVVQVPDRSWVTDVETMLSRGGQAAAVEKALRLPLQQANLTIETPDGDKGQAEFVRDVLYSSGKSQGMNPDLTGIVAQMTYAICVRKTFHELVFASRPDGRIGYKKVAWRPPASCETIRDRKSGDLRGFRQFIPHDMIQDVERRGDPRDVAQVGRVDVMSSSEMGYVRIPINRAMIYVHGQHRDPINGVSDLAVTHWAYTLQQKILLLWATFLEGEAMAKVIAYGDTGPEAVANAKAIATLRGSGVLGLKRNVSDPSSKVFEILETGGNGQAADQFHAMINYLDQQMTRSVLAGFLDLTAGATRGAGSYALSADQSGLFLNSRQSVAKEIAACVTDQLIKPLVRINFGPEAAVPRLVFEKMSADQNDKALQLLQQLGSAQNLQVPSGFIDLLTERVGQFLDLSDEKMEKLIKEHAEQQKKLAEMMGRPPEQSGSFNGQVTDHVNGAQQLIKQAQTGQPLRPAPATTPTATVQEAVKQRHQEKQ